MDKHFLEFWGNVLIQAAKNQQQLEDLERWTREGKGLFEGPQDFFKKIYDFEGEREADKGPDVAEKWKESFEGFRSSFFEMMDMFGMVPKEDYKVLQKRCEELERELAEKENMIRKSGPGGADIQDLIQKQGEQYRELMKSMTTFYNQGLSPKGKGRK